MPGTAGERHSAILLSVSVLHGHRRRSRSNVESTKVKLLALSCAQESQAAQLGANHPTSGTHFLTLMMILVVTIPYTFPLNYLYRNVQSTMCETVT